MTPESGLLPVMSGEGVESASKPPTQGKGGLPNSGVPERPAVQIRRPANEDLLLTTGWWKVSRGRGSSSGIRVQGSGWWVPR